MDKVFTSAQVAKRLGVTPRAVRALAKRYDIGTLLTDRMLVFTDSDYDALAKHSDGTRGRPKRKQESQ